MAHTIIYSDQDAARALTDVIGDSSWNAVAFAAGFQLIEAGKSEDDAARAIYERGPQTLRRSRELVSGLSDGGFVNQLEKRTRRGSAENPITKLFPATITEERFLFLLDTLVGTRSSISYSDERSAGHTFKDFAVTEVGQEVPINVKNAGTRFENARQLVGVDPDDCIPIPAYKAHGALETAPNLLYVIAVDYSLVSAIESLLPQLLDRDELIVWDLLNRFAGAKVRDAEDKFIFTMVRKYWQQFESVAANRPFHVVSARKAVRILQTIPRRTPGIGLRAWGTGASAEVNVHLSIAEDTTPWETVSRQISSEGLADVITAVNRKRLEYVYDPEI